MVLSNYKCMHIWIQNSRILFQQLQVHSSNVSSNRIKIQEILLILQLETDYFSKLFISEMLHSKQWHYSLHRDFQNCYSTRRSPTEFFSSNSNSTRAHYITLHPENSPSRIQFYIQKTKSSSSTTTTYRGQGDLQSRFKKRNSTHRRQGDLLEIHPCVLHDIPGIPATPVAPKTFRTFQSFMTFQPFQAILQILQCSSISRESTPFQHSPIRIHILHILQFLQFDWFPQKTPPSTSWTITNITFFKEREMLRYRSNVHR